MSAPHAYGENGELDRACIQHVMREDVDDATIDAGSPEDIQDPEMLTCLRESMLSVAFAPPGKGGAVTVDYPFEFSP